MEHGLASSGYHANVRPLTPAERLRFPNAELARESDTTDAAWALRNFHRHRLVGLLWPDAFIDVVAAAREDVPTPSSDSGMPVPQRYRTKLFSKRAPVPDDHLVFSAHLTPEKKSVCACDACRRHRVFHGANDLEFVAYERNGLLKERGVDVPWYDPSDYCLTEKGILFFEVDHLHPKKVSETIEAADISDEDRVRARAILARIAVLTRQSRDGMLFAGAGGVEMKPT